MGTEGYLEGSLLCTPFRTLILVTARVPHRKHCLPLHPQDTHFLSLRDIPRPHCRLPCRSSAPPCPALPCSAQLLTSPRDQPQQQLLVPLIVSMSQHLDWTMYTTHTTHVKEVAEMYDKVSHATQQVSVVVCLSAARTQQVGTAGVEGVDRLGV